MTTQAQVATIFPELLKDVFDALVGRPTNDLEMKRWERDAEKLQRASKGQGLEIKAMIAAIRGDDAESDRLFEAALSVTEDYTGTAARYLSVLSSRLRPIKLLEVYRALRACFKGNPDATRFVERLLAGEGFMISAWELSEELGKMGSYSAATPTCASERATQVIDPESYQDVDFGAPVAFTKQFLTQRNVDWNSTNVSASVGDESKAAVFFQFRTDQSPEEAIQTEAELFEALEDQAFPVEMTGKMVLALVGTRAVLS